MLKIKRQNALLPQRRRFLTLCAVYEATVRVRTNITGVMLPPRIVMLRSAFLPQCHASRRWNGSFSNTNESRTKGFTPEAIANRRRWESRLVEFVESKQDEQADRQRMSFDQLYRNKDYIPIEEAFPRRKLKKDQNDDASAAHHVRPARADCDVENRSTGDHPVSTTPPAQAPLHRRNSTAEREQQHRVTIALLGPANCGKSSLLNALATSRVSAVAPTAGSTRDWCIGVSTIHDTQIEVIDTPGISPVPGVGVAPGVRSSGKSRPSQGGKYSSFFQQPGSYYRQQSSASASSPGGKSGGTSGVGSGGARNAGAPPPAS